MKLYERELCLYKLFRNGYELIDSNGKKIVYQPSVESRIKAQEAYNNTLIEISYEDVFDDDTLLKFMIFAKMWTEEKEKILTDILPHNLEQLKVDLFNNFFNEDNRKNYKRQISVLEHELQTLQDQRHQYDWLTVNGIAIYYKIAAMLEYGTRFEDGRLYDWSGTSLMSFLSFINKEYLKDEQIRNIARNEPWQNIWRTSNKDASIFGLPSVNLNDEQKKLLLWSGFYDNIHESPDCPADDVIDDDDALDGWLIIQRRNKTKAGTENLIKSKLTNSKIANADEIFVVASNEDEAHKIYDMNTSQGKSIIKQRLDFINKKGETAEQDMPDVKMKLGMMANQAFINAVKGK